LRSSKLFSTFAPAFGRRAERGERRLWGEKGGWEGPCAGREEEVPLRPCFGGTGGEGMVGRREAGPGGGRCEIRREFFDAMVPI
jgi:hypothetical protein